MNSDIQISVVIPVYNEESIIEQTCRRLKKVMDSTGESYELIFVDDGSCDNSAVLIKSFSEHDENIKLISFSRNFGHQIAITAGMDYAAGNAVVVIDADLQDPPELISEMIKKWKAGYDVVYAKRTRRKGETLFKKATASMFYRLMQKTTDITIPLDTGDFRLLDRKVCDALKTLTEKNRYVRGLVSWVGFRQIAVEYERDERAAGETKYTLKKMIKFSLDGLTSFSYKPIKLAYYVGILLMLMSLISLFAIFGFEFGASMPFSGWCFVIISQFFVTGLILLSLGFMGEYIGRIYDEARNRPLYIVKECYKIKKKERTVKKVV